MKIDQQSGLDLQQIQRKIAQYVQLRSSGEIIIISVYIYRLKFIIKIQANTRISASNR
ncbi:hypothetical protein SLEP1_g38410 [Rubroshorea leprosula]|nr:hypothetical protein SLEP1_g38410 [Rubroshorea leprosula]